MLKRCPLRKPMPNPATALLPVCTTGALASNFSAYRFLTMYPSTFIIAEGDETTSKVVVSRYHAVYAPVFTCSFALLSSYFINILVYLHSR